jgi:hypothetical protein
MLTDSFSVMLGDAKLATEFADEMLGEFSIPQGCQMVYFENQKSQFG